MPGVDLMADAVGDGVADHLLEAVGVDVLAAVVGEHDVDDVLGPRQAADVGGEDPGAVAHLVSPTALRSPLRAQV